MQKNLILIGLLTLITLTITWALDFTARQKMPENTPREVSKNYFPLPDFSYTTVVGNTFSLPDDINNRIILIHFWATWCAPCVIELPLLIQFAKENSKNILVIAINSNRNPKDSLVFLDKIKAPMNEKFIHFVDDPKGEITRDIFQTTYLPETIIVNQRGLMVDKIAGDADWSDQKVTQRITGLFMPQPNIKNNEKNKAD